MRAFTVEEGFVERIWWLIKLRWVAIIGVVIVIPFSRYLLRLSLPIPPLYAIAFILITYNLTFFYLLIRIKKNIASYNLFLLSNLQISFDLASLAGLIHLSGGIENPFIFYFIFHMIIASILLSRRASFLQATFAVLLFSLIVVLEYFKILPHYCLKGFILHNQHDNALYISGVSFVFITTLYIAVYMTTSISNKLKSREAALRQANDLLEEKDKIKSEYVLRVTHDIKEHLSAIQSCLQPVTGGLTGALNEKQRDLLDRADQRTGKLMFFVRALLEITRIKLSKEIEMKHFSLKDSVYNAISLVDARAKEKDIVITFSIEPGIGDIKGAQIYIEETIANLLANAVKYTAKDGKIDVSVKDKGESVSLQIADTGIGIPKDEIPKVFDEFYRASNAREFKRDGTGLGLSIAKQVVERHKGKIWVESEVGKGSTFSMLLPKDG